MSDPNLPASARLRLPGVLPGPEVIRKIREETDTILLSFSCGKDAIATWLELRPHFPRIIPFYMYLVQGLEFIEESLRYFEGYFQTPIIRLPSPALYRMLRNKVFQTPERSSIIDAAGLKLFSHGDLRLWLCEDLGIDPQTWYASGVRASDSPNRRTSLKLHGPFTQNKRVFYPIWDMKKDELVELLCRSQVKVPVDYQIFGRSFDGIDFRFLAPIKKHFPADYARILELFPLADLELERARFAGKAA